MDHSKSYLALDRMIEQGWLATGISDFEQVLNKLEEGGHITRAEHQSLLLRFMGKKVEERDPGEEQPGLNSSTP
jgi:hypothetical protein